MSPLPKSFDLVAIRLRRMIIEKRRPEAKRLALDALAKGKASAQVQKIAADLFGGKRGRPVSGAKHRWMEMGEINDDMRDAGKSYEQRLAYLKKKFHVGTDKTIKLALAKYERAQEEYRTSISDDGEF
jgi:hypothetical protein